ncbi:Ras family protein [Histomonas meleagridis]|uniref:Ras family protein n=1 Tax=Histomonas meleagridis TaxID=135588 RepID=UPI003559D2A6|nr:Ras family protein [Histomonas meleagridis]KAH0801423.1 Ras family protein [Histomonas meleagridis]
MNAQAQLVKFIVIGNAGVGKTSIINRLVRDDYDPEVTPTIGVDYVNFDTTVQNEPFHIIIWDTAGQERYFNIIRNYFRNSLGIILVFDITSRHSFEKIPFWLKTARKEADPNCQVMLIGNKSDFQSIREVSNEEAEKFAEENQILCYMETSALNNKNIKEAFMKLTEKIYNLMSTGEINIEPYNTATKVSNNDSAEETKKSCC